MVDSVSPKRRSEIMSLVKAKNSAAEMVVRRLLHAEGYRYRLHAKDLPGKPDLVFRSRRKVVFVHGCFWHSHDAPDCPDRRQVKSNVAYWVPKLARNRERDAQHVAALERNGWKVLVLWECELANAQSIVRLLRRFLKD